MYTILFRVLKFTDSQPRNLSQSPIHKHVFTLRGYKEVPSIDELINEVKKYKKTNGIEQTFEWEIQPQTKGRYQKTIKLGVI